VQVDEAGRDDEPRGVEDLRAFGAGLAAFEEGRDAAVFDQQVAAGVDALGRVDDVTVGDE
jgi:hypothetical protein